MLNPKDIKEFLEEKYQQYASPQFIESDPIQVPKRYSKKGDVEIAGFLTATLSWGQRPQIIRFANSLMDGMGDSPWQFVAECSKEELQSLNNFYYRTFNGVDCVAFISSLKRIYTENGGLDALFNKGYEQFGTMQGAITFFRQKFLGSSFPHRSHKHVSNPQAGSAAKRINMFLRWMVRPSTEGVDFGLWRNIPKSALMLPLDVHSGRVARALGLLNRKDNSWKAVEEVTSNLRQLDSTDPVKYDFALFGLGVFEKF